MNIISLEVVITRSQWISPTWESCLSWLNVQLGCVIHLSHFPTLPAHWPSSSSQAYRASAARRCPLPGAKQLILELSCYVSTSCANEDVRALLLPLSWPPQWAQVRNSCGAVSLLLHVPAALKKQTGKHPFHADQCSAALCLSLIWSDELDEASWVSTQCKMIQKNIISL